MSLTQSRRTRKPNVGARLNLGDRRTRGLRYCFPFNEGGGGYSAGLRNLAPQDAAATQAPGDGVIGSTTSVTWSAKRCLTWASSTTSYVDCGANTSTANLECTWIIHCRPTSLPALATLFGQNTTGGAEDLESVYLESSKLSWWTVDTTSHGGLQPINGTATLSANTFYRFAGRRSGAAGAWVWTTWINEEQDDTASTAYGCGLDASNAEGNFRIGFAGNYTSAPFIGDMDLFLFWNGVALKDDDLLSLSANPWQLWEPVRRKWFVNAAAGGVTMPADSGSYSLTGGATSLEYGRRLVSESGSYSITGSAASLERGYPIVANSGAYSITGGIASLEYGRVVAANSGSYAVSGGAASLEYGRTVAANGGTYAVSGGAASLEYGRKLGANSGSYSLTGSSVTLTYSGSGGVTMPADSGSYSITGSAASLEIGYKVQALSGSYSITGSAASLEVGKKLGASSGSYLLTGGAANFQIGRRVIAASGSYVLTGTAAGLIYGTSFISGTLPTFNAIERDLEFNHHGRDLEFAGIERKLSFGRNR